MFCHHCGSQIGDDAVSCIHCGALTQPKAPAPGNALPGMMYCRNCGSQIPREAFACVHCGVKVAPTDPIERALFPGEGRSWLVTLLLCWFLGIFGVHRFYTGHTLIGLLQLVTLGGCGVWWIIDLIMILVGNYRDFEDRPLVK